MKRLFLFSLFVLFSIIIKNSYAQCSDAGICRLAPPSHKEEIKRFSLGVGYAYGYSGKTDEISYHSLQFDAGYNFSEQTSINLLLPYNKQSGPLGNVSGIGDLILGISHSLELNQKSSLQFSAGVKLATGADNKNELPQKYQSGLGSTDILLGTAFNTNNITLGLGYQIAGERNSNMLELKRGDDLLIRGGYTFRINKFMFDPQLLIINRLGKSSIIDLTRSYNEPAYIDVEDSDQLQISLLVPITYQINNNYSVVFDFALPFIKREVNVDGLTRAISSSLTFRMSY